MSKLFKVHVDEIIVQRCVYYVEADTEAEAKLNAAEYVGIDSRDVMPDSGRGECDPLRRDVLDATEI